MGAWPPKAAAKRCASSRTDLETSGRRACRCRQKLVGPSKGNAVRSRSLDVQNKTFVFLPPVRVFFWGGHGSERTQECRNRTSQAALLSDGRPGGEPAGEACAPHATAAPLLLAPPARPPGAARRLPSAPGRQSPPPPLRPPPAAPPPAAPAAAPWQPPARTLPPASAVHLSLSDPQSARWSTHTTTFQKLQPQHFSAWSSPAVQIVPLAGQGPCSTSCAMVPRRLCCAGLRPSDDPFTERRLPLQTSGCGQHPDAHRSAASHSPAAPRAP